MTLEDWLAEQKADFWRLPLPQKLAAVWQAARREARWDFERDREHERRYLPTTPRKQVHDSRE